MFLGQYMFVINFPFQIDYFYIFWLDSKIIGFHTVLQELLLYNGR
jgi:hypothetical protein